MSDSSNYGAALDGSQAKERRLESWGEIAAYLRREIRTVQRWEKTLGLPVHRLLVGKQSSVYAYPSELDKWYREREPKEIKEDDSGDTWRLRRWRSQACRTFRPCLTPWTTR